MKILPKNTVVYQIYKYSFNTPCTTCKESATMATSTQALKNIFCRVNFGHFLE